MVSLRDNSLKKPAPSKSPLLEAIRQRWSPRAFSSRPVEREKLLSLFEAARWAASGNNSQPWRFIVVTREDADFQKFVAFLSERNQEWAKNAPVLLLAVAQEYRADGNRMTHADHDTGMAMAHIALQAQELGLQTHMMGGFNVDKAREAFAIPSDYKPLTAMAIGYYGNLEQLSEHNQERERVERIRKPLSEIVFSGAFGKSSDLVEE